MELKPDTSRARSFDLVADLYEQARPGYPEVLFERIIRYAALTGEAHLLEVGVGTGKATVSLARRGYRITGLEPGPNLARVARQNLAAHPRVEIHKASFEQWSGAPGTYDLVFVAQAYHWLDPAQRVAKSAQLLASGGALAIFGNAADISADPSYAAIQKAYADHAGSLLGKTPAREWYASPSSPILAELRGARQLVGAEHELFHWEETVSALQYCDQLRTHSNHTALPEGQLSALLDAIARAIEVHGGSVTIRYCTGLYLARAV